MVNIEERLKRYAPVKLTPDLSLLNESERNIISLLIEAAHAMNDAFWIQIYGDPAPLLASTTDPNIRQYIQRNYGPWDALRDDEPFVTGVGTKPPGANFYPPDMTAKEFEAGSILQPDLASMYTMVSRDSSGSLVAVPYHKFFSAQVQFAADKLRQAGRLINQQSLKAYLNLRADALLTDDYRASDVAWMEMKDNTIDVLIGPIETSADRLYGQKAAYGATILIKDHHWSQRLNRYIQLLPHFQAQLPISAAYKREQPGLASDLYVYDVLYCAGYDNTSVPLGVNLPNDEEVRLLMGTRSLQLKNTMRAKFEKLLVPMANILIVPDQRQYVTFEAFFNLVMFHEMGHGLGIRHTVTGNMLVKDALKDLDHPIEESKANLLSLFIITYLNQIGDVSDAELREAYVTMLANMLRVSDSRQALLQLHFFKKMGAYSRDPNTKTYQVHLDRMEATTNDLAEHILRLQGDGNYEEAKLLLEKHGHPDSDLDEDIQRFESIGAPLEIVLEQE
jgi:hypothetical protein